MLAIPALLTLFKLVHRHYARLADETCARRPLDLTRNRPPVVLVPIRRWDRPTEKALRFSMWLSTEVIGVHLGNLTGEEAAEEEQRRVQSEWDQDVVAPARRHGVPAPRLVTRPCPYRNFLRPLLAQIDRVKAEFPDRLVAVVIPEVIETRWWQQLLHGRKAARLRAALLKRGDHRVVVVNVPWYVAD